MLIPGCCMSMYGFELWCDIIRLNVHLYVASHVNFLILSLHEGWVHPSMDLYRLFSGLYE
jgi:hypothetical protein